MRFYRTGAGLFVTSLDKAGPKGTFETLDVPTDKNGLLEFLNILVVGDGVAVPAAEFAEVDEAPMPTFAPSTNAVVEAIRTSAGPEFAYYTEAAIERLGELGDQGRNAIDSAQSLGSIGFCFSRGVHLLALIALTQIAGGEHQFDRLIRRDRKALAHG